MTFWYLQPVFKKLAKAGLNSLRQQGSQISVDHWNFDDSFHKKVILVLGMIQPSGSGMTLVYLWDDLWDFGITLMLCENDRFCVLCLSLFTVQAVLPKYVRRNNQLLVRLRQLFLLSSSSQPWPIKSRLSVCTLAQPLTLFTILILA